MGEIADMMLEGTLCEICGAYIPEGEPDGFPRKCIDCKPRKKNKKKKEKKNES